MNRIRDYYKLAPKKQERETPQLTLVHSPSSDEVYISLQEEHLQERINHESYLLQTGDILINKREPSLCFILEGYPQETHAHSGWVVLRKQKEGLPNWAIVGACRLHRRKLITDSMFRGLSLPDLLNHSFDPLPKENPRMEGTLKSFSHMVELHRKQQKLFKEFHMAILHRATLNLPLKNEEVTNEVS